MGKRRKKKPHQRPWHGGGRAPHPLRETARPLACKRCGEPAGIAVVIPAGGRLACPADGCGGFLARVKPG